MAGILKRLVPRRFRNEGVTIPVVRLQGAIMANGSQFRPALNLASAAPVLEKAFGDKKAPAVAIAINSPGGSPVQSRLMYARRAKTQDRPRKSLTAPRNPHRRRAAGRAPPGGHGV